MNKKCAICGKELDNSLPLCKECLRLIRENDDESLMMQLTSVFFRVGDNPNNKETTGTEAEALTYTEALEDMIDSAGMYCERTTEYGDNPVIEGVRLEAFRNQSPLTILSMIDTISQKEPLDTDQVDAIIEVLGAQAKFQQSNLTGPEYQTKVDAIMQKWVRSISKTTKTEGSDQESGEEEYIKVELYDSASAKGQYDLPVVRIKRKDLNRFQQEIKRFYAYCEKEDPGGYNYVNFINTWLPQQGIEAEIYLVEADEQVHF